MTEIDLSGQVEIVMVVLLSHLHLLMKSALLMLGLSEMPPVHTSSSRFALVCVFQIVERAGRGRPS